MTLDDADRGANRDDRFDEQRPVIGSGLSSGRRGTNGTRSRPASAIASDQRGDVST
jgi:hypothetical protein